MTDDALLGVLVGGDAVVAGKLAKLAASRPLTWVGIDEVADDRPSVVVVDLEEHDAAVGELRARWPQALLVGFVSLPDQARWVAAQRAGCDVVVNRGALAARLRTELARVGAPTYRFPLVAADDLAGRLGLVGRITQSPVGPVAVYQVDGVVSALADSCPHAGATLSDGALEGVVVTCPRHGSQFDVVTGERLRGPADCAVRTFPTEVTSGQVVMVLNKEDP